MPISLSPRLILTAILCLLSSWARADLPLTIENLLTVANRWQKSGNDGCSSIDRKLYSPADI